MQIFVVYLEVLPFIVHLPLQELWRLIQDEKIAGRCIIITTHHMEEADILADRKAIMTAGRMRCVGSSLFLKSRFGIGYYLEVSVSPKLPLDIIAESILQFLHRFAPEAKRHVDDQKSSAVSMAAAKRNLLLFQLPISAVRSFADLFRELNAQMDFLGILEYGVSLSTLEEVFFKLGEEEERVQLEAGCGADGDDKTPMFCELEAITKRRGSVFLPESAPSSEGKRWEEGSSMLMDQNVSDFIRPSEEPASGSW